MPPNRAVADEGGAKRQLCLTGDERQRIARGDYGNLVREDEPEIMLGVELDVASNLWITPMRLREGKAGWKISYSVRDFRVRKPRRVPHMYEPPELDQQGEPLPLDAEAIKAATEDGNYTASTELAVPEIDDAVPAAYQNVLTLKSREKWAMNKRSENTESEAREDLRRLNDEMKELVKRAVKMGIDPTTVIGPIAREIQSQHRGLKEAA